MGDTHAHDACTSLCGAFDEFSGRKNNCLKGVKWSPDGTCLLTASEDQQLRLYELPAELSGMAQDGGAAAPAPAAAGGSQEMSSAVRVAEGDSIYDYCWYPLMHSAEPSSCCFLSACRDHPMHLWDAYTGSLRASYAAYNHLDEITSTFRTAINPDGTRLYAGYDAPSASSTLTVGRQCELRATSKNRKPRGAAWHHLVPALLARSMRPFAAGSSPARPACTSTTRRRWSAASRPPAAYGPVLARRFPPVHGRAAGRPVLCYDARPRTPLLVPARLPRHQPAHRIRPSADSRPRTAPRVPAACSCTTQAAGATRRVAAYEAVNATLHPFCLCSRSPSASGAFHCRTTPATPAVAVATRLVGGRIVRVMRTTTWRRTVKKDRGGGGEREGEENGLQVWRPQRQQS